MLAMRLAEKTRQEIANKLGLNKIQIKNRINRHNKKTDHKQAGILPIRRGRKPAITLLEYKSDHFASGFSHVFFIF